MATITNISYLPHFLLSSQQLFLNKDFIYLFLDREDGWEKEGEKHQCVVASHAPRTGDLAHNPGMCPDWESNQRPTSLQAGTQSTEPQQPGLQQLYTASITILILHVEPWRPKTISNLLNII